MMFGLFKALATPEQAFWNWFEKNEKMLFSFESNRDRVFSELAANMKPVHESVTFEFGPVVEGNGSLLLARTVSRTPFLRWKDCMRQPPNSRVGYS